MIFNMDIPLEYIGGAALLIVALFLGFFYFFNYYLEMKRKHPELHVLQLARKKPFPSVIVMVDPSDKTLMFNGVLEKKTDIKLNINDYGLLIDPHQVTKMPKTRMEDGTSVFYYGAGFHFPTSLNGARTIIQFIAKIRSDYRLLNFIRDDIVLMEMFTKSGEDLPKDIKSILNMYPLEKPVVSIDILSEKDIFPLLTEDEKIDYYLKKGEDDNQLTVQKIVEIVEDAKSKVKGWQVHPGYFSIHDGISLLPIGTMASDMSRLETVTKMNTANDFMKAPDPWMNTLKFLGIIAAGVLVIWMIVSAMKPGGG